MARKTNTLRDPVARFVESVRCGEVVVGPFVRLACARHAKDIAEQKKRGLRWDTEAAVNAIGFFHDVLRLNGGDFEGQPFILRDWQQFIVGSIFGWKVADEDVRRFRVAYIECAKGNGKTPLAAGIGLKMLVADGESRAEVYAAAVDKDQAKIVFRDAVAMVDLSDVLDPVITRSGGVGKEWNLAYHRSGSFFRPISSEHRGRGKSGPRPHCAILDEVHEHPTSAMVEFMRAGTKGRRQALQLEITNSGWDRQSVCYQHHAYTDKVLNGILEDDSWFGFIASLDEGDDPFKDESCWIKANPNLDVSVTRKYLREQLREARGMPAKQNLVLRLNFCVWTEQDKVWIPDVEWWACRGEVDPDALKGRECYAGMDLASTSDITALVLDFPEGEGKHIWLPFFWIPGDNVEKRVQKDHVPYDVWIRQGLMMTTPGNVIDYDFIRSFINETLAPKYHIKEIALDRLFQSAQMATNLQADGHTVVAFGQGFLSMAAPCKALEEAVLSRKLNHGGNPILRWMNTNIAIQQDPAGNKKPDKSRSRDKIDGIVAGLMALARAEANGGEGASVYETRGVIAL